MNREQILDDTIEFYSKNPRAFTPVYFSNECHYNMADGRKCAVGRLIVESIPPGMDMLLPRDLWREYPEWEMVGGGTLGDLEISDIRFLGDLQSLHDEDTYWAEGGLTAAGLEEVAKIREKWL